MKIGYPCINLSLDCRPSTTFRLASYSERRLIETIEDNLRCLLEILKYNLEHGILFFRITSDLVPFASHPVCKFNWQDHFRSQFDTVGEFIRRHEMRISMHPDQFTIINSPDESIFANSVRELQYHSDVLDLLGLDASAKMQIHVGGVYGDKDKSLKRFVQRFEMLGDGIRKRLVIENDDRSYRMKDCLGIHDRTGIPVLFDYFHHTINNNSETTGEIFRASRRTWGSNDGLPMVDYSSQQRGERRGVHARTLSARSFSNFLGSSHGFDFDLMLEIGDKERSASKAIEIASQDPRVLTPEAPI